MRQLKKILIGFSFLLALSVLPTVLQTQKALAAVDGVMSDYGVKDSKNIQDSIKSVEWIDAAKIKLTFKNGKTLEFTPNNGLRKERMDLPYNSLLINKTITYINNSFGCVNPAKIKFTIGNEVNSAFKIQSFELKTGRIDIDFRKDVASDCSDGNEFDQQMAKPNLSIAYFKWIDPNKIGMVDGQAPGTFSRTAAPPATFDGATYDVFLSDSDASKECRDKLFLNKSNNTIKWFDLGTTSKGNPPNVVSENCNYNKDDDKESWPRSNYTWSLANAASSVAGVTPSTTTDATPEPEVDNSCEAKSGAMGWILCPVVNLMDGALNWIDTEVQALLAVDENKYTDADLKDAWSTIRDIAYIILIPIMLVMVIGTALGLDAFNAYTIKKALPRMVAAIIFITLSWSICTFLVTASNVVGSGILGLMTSQFYPGGGGMNLSSLYEASEAAGFTQWGSIALATLAAYLIVSGGLAGAAIAILILLFLGALISIFIGFVVLLLRQMFIVGLILVAPLAILAWIFPGNDKLWKTWWSVFSKLLLMFPLIMAIIAMGRIFAWLLGNTGSTNTLTPILKLIAYIAPYFFIPFTFKFAGGVFANLAGIVNDRSRGLKDRSKKMRQGILKDAHEKTYSGQNKLGSNRRIGNAYRRATMMGRNGSFSMSSAGRARFQEESNKIFETTADEMNKNGGARAFNDDDASELLRDTRMTRDNFIAQYSARMQTSRKVSAEEGRVLAERALRRAEGAVGARVGSTAMAVAAQKFRTSNTNSAYAAKTAGLQQLQSDLLDLQNQGLISASDAASWMKSNQGRIDYRANSFGETMKFVSGQITAREQIAGAFEGADPREIVGGHQRAVESFADQAQINLTSAIASGNQKDIDTALADVANIYDTLSSVSPKKAQEFADQVYSMDTGIRSGNTRIISPDDRLPTGEEGPAINTMTVRELMDSRRDSAIVLDRRREYSNALSAMQQNRGGTPPEEPPHP